MVQRSEGYANHTRGLQLAQIALVAAIVVVHLGITWIYNAPDNIVKIDGDAIISRYMGHTFFQNWSFFAPSPIDRNTYLMARAERADGSFTPWTNISVPLIEQVQRNRFSAYELVSTGVSNAVLNAAKSYVDLKKSNKTADPMTMPDLRDLYRSGASVLMHQYPGTAFEKIQIGVLDEIYPRFTHRREGDERSKRQMAAFDLVAFPHDVDTTGW